MALDYILIQLQTAALAIKHGDLDLTTADWRDVDRVADLLREACGVWPGGEAIGSSED